MKNFRTYQLAVQFYNNSKNLYLKEPLKNQFQRAILEHCAKSSRRKCQTYNKRQKKILQNQPRLT